MGINASFFQKFAVSSLLCDSLLRKNQDSLRILDRRKPVGDDEGSSVLCQLLQGFLYNPLALIIKRRGGLVKDQYRRIL